MTQSGERQAVLGLWHDDVLYAMRVQGVRGKGVTAHSRAVIIPKNDPEELLETLHRETGFGPREPIFIVDQHPLLYGSAVSLTIPRHESNHPVVRDTREIKHLAEWQVGNTVREQAAKFFECSLQDIEERGTGVELWRETANNITTTLVHMCEPKWNNQSRVDHAYILPNASLVALPLLLAHRIGMSEELDALVWVGEERTILLIRSNRVIREIRTVSCGMREIREWIKQELRCGTEEARSLISLWEEGRLSKDHVQMLNRVTMGASELFSEAIHVLTASIPGTRRPHRLFLYGMHMKIIRQICFQGQYMDELFDSVKHVEIFRSPSTDKELSSNARQALSLIEIAASALFHSPNIPGEHVPSFAVNVTSSLR